MNLQPPSYDRAGITTGIVHFGVGGFHRAHQAMYLDRLLEKGQARDWGICGVGVLPFDARMRDVMAAQDCLYTLSVTRPDGSWDTQVIGAIVEYLYAPDDPAAVVAKLADERTRIVSLTITEGGYSDDNAATFDLLVEGLARRRDGGLAPFTVMSCDNIESNGHVAKATVLAFARRRDPALAEWIEAEGAFPSSMVDRITPATTAETIAEVAQRSSIDDAWPVVTEPFTQWVLEDDFTCGRPPYEDAGVQLVADVAPYELMKLRLLNASHQAMAYFGYLSGYRLVHEVAQDPVFVRFLLRYMDSEATPTLRPVSGVDLDEYKRTLIERFSNPSIRDTVARLCADSSNRIPKWLLPVIAHQLDTGGEIDCSAAIVASWARYARGVDEQGEPIEIVDERSAELVPLARSADPIAFLSARAVFGDLADSERFVAEFRAARVSLDEVGAHATVARYDRPA